MYRYYTVNDLNILYSLIGESPTFKFTAAHKFNDPKEFVFKLYIDKSDPRLKENFFRDNENKTEDDFTTWFNYFSDGHILSLTNKIREDMMKTTVLGCLTDSPRNNLMWAHYTNDHHGICVKYAEDLLSFFENEQGYIFHSPITYQSEPAKLDFIYDSPEEYTKKICSIKEAKWSYENEIRIGLFSFNDTEFVNINIKQILEVIIGIRTPDKIAEQVASLCLKSNIKVSRATSASDSYEIEIIDYEKQ